MKFNLQITFILTWLLAGSLPRYCSSQILFSKECFAGGVMAVGINKDGDGSFGNSCNIHWDESFTVRKIYLICYRYGRPDPHYVIINNSDIAWNYDNQVGPELPDQEELSEYYATHVQDITDQIEISEDELFIDFPPQGIGGNRGWHSAYLIIHYEAPSITEVVCSEIYIADQRQDQPQDYTFETPQFNSNHPLLFSIFSSRITDFFIDRNRVYLNNLLLGEIWMQDLVNSANNGVQGHYYYENQVAEGLNGDTANTSLWKHDALANIAGQISEEGTNNLTFLCAEYSPDNPSFPNCANLVPSFTLTYVPECNTLPVLSEMVREYSFCRGDTVQLATTDVYESFSWSTANGLNDSTSSSPLCFADSSHWYTVRMWNEGEEGCGQTIPIHVEVYDNPVPDPLTVRASLCPANTGRIVADDTPGDLPITYTLNTLENTTGAFDDLAPGAYDLSIETAKGCQWDTSVVIPLNPVHEASFAANPETGFSPLDVFFTNTSTQATDYQWLIDGVPISESEDITYTFPDSGSFTVSLIAYRLEESCADTATFTLRAEPGIRVLMPNIISPNGDGRNDALVAQVSGLASARWGIYNRWGNEVASGEEINPFQEVEIWDPQGEISEGTYSVVLVAQGLAGQIDRFEFSITLVR